jgi:hypothetical protein
VLVAALIRATALAASLTAALAAVSRPPAEAPACAAAVRAALTIPGARAELLQLEQTLRPGCRLAHVEVPRPVAASGRVALRLLGRDAAGAPCQRWAWARVRVSAPSLVTTRSVTEGARLDGAVTPVEREVLPGRPPFAQLPEGATAARALPAGAPLDATLVRIGPPPGEPVTVVVRAGDLVAEQQGEAAACRRGRACAILPSGQRVEGRWHDGRILLESP